MERSGINLLFILFILSFLLLPARPSGEGFVWAEKGTVKQYKAISYNIHRGTTRYGVPSLATMEQVLREEAADFIALQEVDRYRLRSGIQDQINYLANQLGMEYVFAAAIKNGVAQYGNGILSRYPILETGQLALPSGKEPRVLVWAKVMTEQGNMYIISVHLGLDTAERKEQFRTIIDFINSLGNTPVLLMGDLNTLPDNPELIKLREAVTGSSYYETFPTYYHTKAKKWVQIDYILGRGVWEVSTYTFPSEASDHFPLIMEFKIDPFPFIDKQREMIT